MAKRFGDDRSKDKDLDTEIDMEEMDNLSMDDPWGDGSGMNDSGGGRSPSTPTRKMVVEGVKGLAEGAMSAVGEEVERNMPNLYTVKSEVSETFDDLKELKDEVAKQLQPMMLSMENATRKILPRAEKFMPKKLYNKIKGTLDERAEARAGMLGRSKEEERNDLISSELAGVFGSVTTELEKHKELEHHKERLMDKAVSSIQHRDLKHGLTRIYDSVRSTELFHRTLHTAYMKKSLELQYKHLFVAQDTHNLLARTFVAYEDYFKGIVKNTSLPDVMKTQASDYIKKSRTEKYGTMMADFMTNARKMIFKKIKDSASDFLSNVGMIAQLGEMGADQLEALDDPMMAEAMGLPAGLKGLIVRKVAGFLGKGAAAGPVRTALQKISPLTTALNGDMENFKRRAYMNLAKLGNKWRSETGSWWKPLLGDYIPNISAATTASNDLLAKSDDAAAFDKLTRQSIVEIIPGYLGKIWHEIALLRDPNAEERTFNIYSRGFTSVSQYQRDILNDKQMFGTEDSQTEAVRDAVMVLNTNNSRKNPSAEKFSDDLKSTLSRIITNHAVKVQFFNPQEIAEFILAPNSKRTVYIEDISQGCDPELFYKTCKAIIDGLKDKDGKLDQRYVKKFEDAILNVFDSTDNFKTRLATVLESWGSRRYLDGILVDKSNAINLDTIGRELSRFKIEDTGESAWKRRNLEEWIDAKDKVAAQVANAKKRYHDSAIGKKLDSWKAEYEEWRAGNKEDLPPIEGLTGAEPPPEGPDGGGGSGGAAASIPTTGKDGKPLTPEEQKKLLEERFKEGAKKKVGGWLSFLWNKAKSTLDKQLDKLPKNEEDVEKQVESIQASLTAIYDSRPKSAEEAKQRVTAWVEKLEKDHPELAKRARQLLADANDSRIVIAAKAYGSYGKKKVEEQADKVTKTRWWQFGKKKVESGKKSVTEGWTKFFNWAKKYSDEHLQEIGLDRETLAKAYHGDEEARAKVKAASKKIYNDIKKNGPKVIKEKAEEAKQTLEAKLTEAKTATINAATSTARKLGEAHKATVDMSSKLASEYRTGAGLPEPSKSDEAPTPPEKSPSDLMELLTVWSQSHETNLRTLGELVTSIDETLKNGLSVRGVGGGDGKVIRRERNGFFGRGGRWIGGALRGISTAGIALGKGVGRMYLGMGHLALGGAKAIVNTGRWAANTVGLNPYVDVYVAGQEDKKPVLTWRKQAFGKGVVYADNNERVKQTKDIIKRGVPIIDPENGNVLIDEEMLKAGLWTKSGLWAGLGRAAVVGVKGLFGVEKQVVGGMFSIGKTIAEGLFGVGGGKEEPYVDVYRKGEVDGKPLLTRRQQKKGVYFANGERLEKSSDIHEPVYDADKQILVSPEDIEHGLVDVNGKKLGGQTSARQGLFGKAFDLGGTIAKGIFGETGLKIAGTAIGAIGHVYKGLFDALLGGGKAVGRGFANIGARLFGFDSPSGFGRKAIDGITSRLDTIIQVIKAIAGNGGGGGGYGGRAGSGGGPGGPGGYGGPGGGASDPYFANKKSHRGRGRRGYWKEGKFIPDPNGDSYEKDGPEHPGGAAALVTNAAARVNLKASDNYVRKNWIDPDGDGVEGRPDTDDDDGFGFSDLLWWTLGEKALKKGYNIVRHPIRSAKSAWRWTSGKVVNAGRAVYGAGKTGARVVGAGWKAARHGAGFKGAMKASASAYRRAREATKAAKAVKAAQAARAARLTAIKAAKAGKTVQKVGKMAKAAKFLSKVPVVGKFAKPLAVAAKIAAPLAAGAGAGAAISGAGGGFAAGAGSAAAKGTEAAAKGGSWFSRLFGGGAKAAETAGKGAEAAAKGANAAAKGGSWFSRLFGGKGTTEGAAAGAKAAEKAAAAAGKSAGWFGKLSSGLGKFGNVAGKAAAPLEFIFAGGAANDARKNADQFLGRRATEEEKDTIAGQAAMDTLGLGIGNWLNGKIYGDRDAGTKAALELDKELGIDKYSISTNTSDQLWGSANKWWNPLAYVTDVVDGATGIADSTWKGLYRTTVGGAKALNYLWHEDEIERKAKEEHEKFLADINAKKKTMVDALKEKVYSKLGDIELPGPIDSTETGVRMVTDYRTDNHIKRTEWESMIGIKPGMSRIEASKIKWWDNNSVVRSIVEWAKKYYPPTKDHPKERFEYFKKIYNSRRNNISYNVLRIFGIHTRGDVVAWDTVYKQLEEAANGGSKDAKKSSSEGATPATPAASVKDKVEGATSSDASGQSKPGSGAITSEGKPAEGTAAPKTSTEKSDVLGKPTVPAVMMGGRRRTMTRAQVNAINKKNAEVMKNMPPELKKLIPELLNTLSADDIKRIKVKNEINKVRPKDLARSVKTLNQKTISDMPLIWWQNTKEKSCPTVTMVARDLVDWLGRGEDDSHTNRCTMICAAYLVFGVNSWSPELDKLFIRDSKGAQPGSITDKLWRAFHNGQTIADAAAEDEKNWPQAYKDAKKKYDKEVQARNDAIDKMDSERGAAWKKVTDDYDAKWKEFCKAKNYDDDDDFSIGDMRMRQKLIAEFNEKYGKRPDYHKWLAAHPEFDSDAYRKTHQLVRPILEEYEEAEAKRKAEESNAAKVKSILSPAGMGPQTLQPIKPPFDPTMLGPMNKTNVVQPADISLPRLEMAKQQNTSTGAANVFEQYRKEQQEAAARQQQSLDQMNEMFNTMSPFFKQFGSVIDEKNGLRVAGIPELTAITAAKPVAGNTQIINNTIVQDQNDGLDLRKKQN